MRWVRVHVEPLVSHEGGQRESADLGALDREAGGSRDGSDERDARDEGLLDDLERHAAADGEQHVFERQAAFAQHPPDHFVHGVVAADIFGRRQERAVPIEQARRVDAASLVETTLRGAEPRRQRVDDRVGTDH